MSTSSGKLNEYEWGILERFSIVIEMPGSSVRKTQQEVCLCVGVNDASVTGLVKPYTNFLVTEMYRHVRLNDASVDWT